MWQTEETIEYEAVVEVPDDVDPADYLDGDSEELIEAEERFDLHPVNFERTVESVRPEK